MQTSQPKKISEIWKNVKVYLGNRLEYLRLKAIEKSAKIIADLLSGLLMVFFIAIAFLAATVALAFYLSQLLGSQTMGFGCIALFFIVGSILILWKREKLELLIGNMSIQRYFERHCEIEEGSESPALHPSSYTARPKNWTDISENPKEDNDRK